MSTVGTLSGAHHSLENGKIDAFSVHRQHHSRDGFPACREWIVAADVYCDRGAFTLDESLAILSAAKGMGLKIRAHAEQVTHTGIAAAAARLGASTVDHLERC